MAGRIAYYGGIVRDGLVLNLDAAKKDSYPGTGTTWNDISGNSRSGSLIGGAGYDPANGGSIVFDGVNDYTNITNTLVLNGSFTWNMNCKSNAMSAATNRQVYLGSSGTWFEQSDNDTLFIRNTSEIDRNLELPTGLIPQNTWYNVAITRKADNTFDFYYNGIKQTLRSGGTSPVSASYSITAVGSIGGGGRYWNGNIAQTLVYNRALTDQEVLQNYNAVKARFGL